MRWYAQDLDEAEHKWHMSSALLPLMVRDRELGIVAIPWDWELSDADLCINLCEYNIDGTSQNYAISKVSGLDARVQGQVAAHTDSLRHAARDPCHRVPHREPVIPPMHRRGP